MPRARDIWERFWEKVHKLPGDGCWLWTGARSRHGGYGIVSYKLKPHRAHALSWEFANGTKPTGMVICHKCDNPPCVRPSHLMLGTHRDNIRDMAAKGRQGLHRNPERAIRGTRHHNAKLTDELVREIRTSSESAYALAKRLGVSEPTIARVRQRVTWRHVL